MRRAALLLVLLSSCGPVRTENALLIRVGTLIDGTGAPARRDRAVLVRGGVIETVGDWSLDAPGARVIELRHGTLVPGLIDLHVHVGAAGGAHISAAEQAPDMAKTILRSSLACGVTSLRSLGDDTDVSLPLRGGAPHVHAVGPAFTAVGGHPVPFFSGDQAALRRSVRQVADPAQIGPWMDELVAMRVDAIKAIYDGGDEVTGRRIPKLAKESLAEVIRQAHRSGLRCVVHVGGRTDALEALDLGADGIEHTPAGMDDEVIAKLREKGATWVPTLAVIWQYAAARSEIDAYLARPEVKRAIPRVLQFSAANAPRMSYPGSDKVSKLAAQILDAGLRCLAAAYRGGVKIGVGSDAGNPNIFHGAGLLLELELYVRAGLSPVEAIHCATGRSGEHLGRPGLGTIAPGRPADLLVVNGDASADIRALYDVAAVVVDGRVEDRRDFAAEYELPDRAPAPAFGPLYSVMTDRMFGGASEAAAERGEFWRFHGEVRAGAYYPLALLALELSETGFQVYDAGEFRGLRFSVRGTAPALAVGIGSMSVRDYDLHSASVQVGDAWRTVDVPFAELKQQGFGTKAAFDASRIRTVQFTVSGKGPFDLQIRGPEFYR